MNIFPPQRAGLREVYSVLLTVALAVAMGACGSSIGSVGQPISSSASPQGDDQFTEVAEADPIPNPSDGFRSGVCGSAPAATLNALLPGATFSPDLLTTGSWFGDGIDCRWVAASGEFITATVYVAPDPSWATRRPQNELLFDFEGVPVTLAMGTPVVDGWEEGVPDRAAAAGLVDHIGVQLSKYLPELCQHDVSELFGSLQLTRSTGYEAVCAAHPLVVATERTDAPDEAERVLVAALTAVESGDREAFAALLDSDAQYLAEDPGFTFESSLHASDRYDCTMNGSVVDCYPLDTMVGFFISSVGNSWLITGIYSTESGE